MKKQPSPSSDDLGTLVRSGHAKRVVRLRITIAVALVVVALAAWPFLSKGKAGTGAAQPYVTEPLGRGDVVLTITATGSLEPTNQITVGSELSGTIQTVHVDLNDRVTKGQPLARLDTTKLDQQLSISRASLESARAAVAKSEATLAEAEAALKRQQELRTVSGGKTPSQADFDATQATATRARADLLTSKASLSQAEAQVAIDETNLGKAVIKSPVDGIVLTRSVDPGQTVAASLNAPELFVIAEKLERMKLKISVAEADIGRVKDGLTASFTVDAWPERTYTAKVIRVSYGSTVTNNVVTYETELAVENDDLSLRPGMTATADIRVAESRNVLVVPAAALRFAPSTGNGGTTQVKKSFLQSIVPMPPRRSNAAPTATGEKAAPGTGRVWVLRDGQPQPIEVHTGLSDSRHTEVASNELREGDAVILRANAVTP